MTITKWEQGRNSAIIDVQIMLRENKRLFTPSTYKTFVNRLADVFYSNKELDDKQNFVTYLL